MYNILNNIMQKQKQLWTTGAPSRRAQLEIEGLHTN
jgi:hypothetical protein